MADYIAILQAIVISAVTAGFYAFLGWARSRNPETGEFEEFKSSKFVATLRSIQVPLSRAPRPFPDSALSLVQRGLIVELA